ncbi:MAG: hypothetical protein WDZ45_09785 [Flavobacteriaceae bacterium]
MKLKLFIAVLLGIVTTASAQRMKVESGDFSFLKGQTELKVVMDYSKSTFYKEEMSQEAYVAKRKKEIGDDKGKNEAEKWAADWEHSKKNTFIEKFLASMNKNMDIKASEDADSKYTLIVETVWIYPGWFAAVMKQPAKVTTRLKFVETANPSKVLLVINSRNAPGDSFVGVANNNDRIAEGYAKTGKSLAKMISKKVK